MRKSNFHKKGFTLAETLITLGIIGVVAAIIMPMMAAQHRERQFTTMLRKFNSQTTQSFVKNNAENGEPFVWALGEANNANGAIELMRLLITSHYKTIENCNADGGCWNDGEILYLDKTSSGLNLGTDTSYATVRIIDGTLIATRILDGRCNLSYGTSKGLNRVCAEILVDLNGKKAPNQLGYDTFKFYVTAFGFFPAGERSDTTTSFESHCLNNQDGTGCTGWVIQNANMDYLHCSDIGWQTKTSCKNIFNYEHSGGI